MADETTKQMMRRSGDHRFATRWIVGDGIDIGCGPDPLSKLKAFFPLMRTLRPWDMPDGDAMLMDGVADGSYDFVHSSHCLEHLVDPLRAMTHWVRICKPGGHLIITVPDEDLYEQGIWPSAFNRDHKWTFTILKSKSWSPRSISVLSLLAAFQDQVEILKVEKLDAGFDYTAPVQDQTRGGLAESAIEFVLKKKVLTSPADGDRPHQASTTETPETRLQALEAADRFDEAIALLEAEAAAFQPEEERLVRMARLAEHAHRNGDAMRFLERALATNPRHVMARAYRGFQFMRQGRFDHGAADLAVLYAGRVPHSQIGLFVDEQGQPRRQDGRTVVISADAGLGDTLQFVRYAPRVKALGARVVVESQPELTRLIAMTPGVDEVVPQGGLSGHFDERIPLHSLIGAFRTMVETVPAETPYLRVDSAASETFRQRLANLGPGPKVGLVWAGNPKHPRNASRSIDPALLAPLAAIPGVTLVSLQKGATAVPPGVVDWTDELQDMADTAALVQQLDLVISVDSSVAHLAGALGRPVWLLNRLDACWRWLDGRDDSPWYPTLTQFHQREAGNWREVLANVGRHLAEWAHGRREAA